MTDNNERKPAVKARKPQESKTVVGLDDFERNPEEEKNLNNMMATVFSGQAGERALAYLKQITVNYVRGENVSNDALRHAEGQRWIVGLIERRIENGRRGQ